MEEPKETNMQTAEGTAARPSPSASFVQRHAVPEPRLQGNGPVGDPRAKSTFRPKEVAC